MLDGYIAFLDQNCYYKHCTYQRKKMQEEKLKQILIDVLKSHEKSADIADQIEYIREMAAKLSKEHLIEFAVYLEEECGLTPGVIVSISDKLMMNARAQQLLGAKIIRLWLLYKTYEIMGILKASDEAEKQKRTKLRNLFTTFVFPGADLEALLRASCKAIGEGEEDIKDMVSMTAEGRHEFIARAFKKPDLVQQIAYNPDKGIAEQLNDLISDYHQLPKGTFEQYLMAATILAHVEKNPEGKRKLESIKPPLPFDELTADIVPILRKEYQKENTIISSERQSSFKKIAEKINEKKGQVYDELRALQTKVSSINVLELERLIKKTQESKEMIKGKDVLLMIGNTGSGKSTNILKFLGYDLVPGMFGNLSTLVLTKEPEQAHKSFYTSPEAKSCTRYINAVSVPGKMYKTGTPQNKKTLVICDTPGFGDSAGVQVDIANGVGMINALYGARSVRVAVILPYDSLTGDRMAGAVKMSEIIANLFHELTVLDCIAIYFNKVPKDKVKELPNLIEDKLKHLTESQKSFEKLNTFLNEMLNRARDESNFIDPIKSDYRALFEKLMNLYLITKVKKTFRYDFTIQTKREIERFLLAEKGKVTQRFINNKYEDSAYHFNIVEKLKENLPNHNKVEETYSEITKFIQDEIEKRHNIFDESINEIISCKQIDRTSQKLSESKKQIEKMTQIFGKHEILKISPTKINDLVSINKQKILAQFEDITNVTSEVIQSIKSFSELLDPSLKKAILSKIEESFNEYYTVAVKQTGSRKYSEMRNNLAVMSRLAKFASELTSKTDQTPTIEQLNTLKDQIRSDAQNCFQEISNLTFSENAVITQIVINEIRLRLSQIKAIESLNFLCKEDHLASQLSTTLRKLYQKCRRMIRELEDLNMSLEDEINSNRSLDNKELTSKKKQIELLMKIEGVGEELSEDYEYSKTNLHRKLGENVEILKLYLESLKGNKGEEVLKNIKEIRKAAKIVLQCSKIIEGAQSNEQLTNEIQDSFEKHIQIEINNLEFFQVRQTNQEMISKIRFQIEKIESFGKMSFLGERIAALMKDLNGRFGEKLRAPLKAFLVTEAAYIEEKKHYRSIPFIINRLQNLTFYIFKVKDMLDHDQKLKLVEDQLAIQAKLKQTYRQIEEEVISFQELQFQHKSYPIYLKELIKTLVKINEKPHYSLYLTQYQNLQPSEKLNIIHQKLYNIHMQMESKFQSYHKSIGQLQNMQDLIVDCKFYSDIEETLKTEDFSFRQLQEKFMSKFNQHLTNSEQNIRHLLLDTKPSKIDFSEMQQLYTSFIELNNNEGNKKRKLIVSQLKKIEQTMLADLGRINIGGVKATPTGQEHQESKYHDFMETFQETMILVNGIKRLYTLQADKGQIIIDQAKLKKISAGIIRIFQGEFFSIKEQLESYNLSPIIDKSLQSFRIIEEKLIEIFDLESQGEEYDDVSRSKLDKPDDFNQNRILLKRFIQENISNLKDKVSESPFANKLLIKNTKKLSELLTIFKDYTDKEINIKYREFSPSFKVDEGFQRFYSSYAKNRPDKLESLKDNVRIKMQQLFEGLKENFSSSAEQMQKVQTEITQTIRFLPTELKSKYRVEFQQLKKSLFQDVQSSIKDTSKDIFTNHLSLDAFFNSADKAKKCGQTNIHKMFVDTLQELFTAVQPAIPGMAVSQKIAFVQTSLINVYQSQKAYLSEDLLMLNVLKQKFKLWLRVLKKSGETSFSDLKALFNNNSPNGGNTQQHDIDYETPINNIFKILNFVCQLSNEGSIDAQTQTVSAYEKAVAKLFQAHSEILQDKPAYKLHSSDILERNPMAKVQDYVKCVSLSESILQIFKEQIQKFQSNQKGEKIYFESISEIQFQPSALKGYSDQIIEMVKTINSFAFYTNIKRNMSGKEIEQQLSKLDLCYEILSVRSQFFKKIIENPKQLDFPSISNCLANKLTAFVTEATNEIKGIFSPHSKTEEGMLNFLLRTLTAVRSRERQLKFMPSNQANEIYTSLSKQIKTNFSKLTDQFTRISNSATRHYQNNYKYPASDTKALADTLFMYQKALLDIQDSENYKNEFDKMLNSLQNSPTLAIAVEYELKDRNDDVRSIGKSITSKKNLVASNEQGLPNSEQITKMMQKIVKDKTDITKDEMASLRQAINLFKDKYESYTRQYRDNSNEETINHMVITLKDLGKQLSNQFYQTPKPRTGLEDKANLLAGIMALLVIIKSGGNMQPYLTQIFAVVLLLGLTSEEEELANRLAQMPPGEGKSLVLACLIAYLALVGFKVRCLCYNQYLSNRDSACLKELYEKLGVEGHIKYVTIEELCLEQLKENTTNFAKATTFLQSDSKKSEKEIIRQEFMHTILVVDDISIFFQDDYYGKTFSPSINLRGKQVTDFLRFVWNQVRQRVKEPSPQMLIQSQEFKRLSSRYPNLEGQLKKQVPGMINDALKHHHNYKVHDKRIVYSKNTQRLNGYKTVFAHFHESQKQRISVTSLQKALQINLTVGQFSYGSLRTSFAHILAVTGTFNASSPFYQEYIAKEMGDFYILPSVYPGRPKIIQEYTIAPNEGFNSCLMDRIKAVKEDRPIVVFFKDLAQLEEFKDSQAYKSIASKVNIVSESQENASKQSNIQKAVVPGSITLMLSSFGRGTDFQILDDKVKQSGGLHIIQAFLSLDEGEELEIKGRAARKTSRGSYDCVFNQSELEMENPKGSSVFEKIGQSRKQRIINSSETLKKMVEQASSKHEKMKKVYQKSTSNMQLNAYISELNYCSLSKEVTVRTIIGIDASPAMTPALKKIVLCIDPIFKQANEILNQTKTNATIEIKMIAYRDYDSSWEQILESTNFEQTATNIRAFLQTLKARRTWGNNVAVEVLLQAVNKEKDFDQVILIGNAGPNAPYQISQKRQKSKLAEKDWNSNGFPITNLNEELKQLQQRGCPVHSCYLRESTTGFNKISKQTNGIAAQFQINPKQFERDLIGFIVERLLQQVEMKSDRPNLNLVEAYTKPKKHA